MSKGRWGESFLKTGVPLEHLTLMTLNSLGWKCELRKEYRRPDTSGSDRMFEIDLIATRRVGMLAEMSLVVECKYHDEGRFWFFMPCATADHVSRSGAAALNDDPESDSMALYFMPVNPLVGEPSGLLDLAPKSFWGAVVSQDGAKQENAVQSALNQLAYAFAPTAVAMFDNPMPLAILPLAVTSAKIFRLRPEIVDLDLIREANSPSDIADELPWTWCHCPLNSDLMRHNYLSVKRRFKAESFLGGQEAGEQLRRLWYSPTWIAVANVFHLANSVHQISEYFDNLEKEDRLRDCIDIATKIWEQDYPGGGSA